MNITDPPTLYDPEQMEPSIPKSDLLVRARARRQIEMLNGA